MTHRLKTADFFTYCLPENFLQMIITACPKTRFAGLLSAWEAHPNAACMIRDNDNLHWSFYTVSFFQIQLSHY